jgi:hypothetical protein
MQMQCTLMRTRTNPKRLIPVMGTLGPVQALRRPPAALRRAPRPRHSRPRREIQELQAGAERMRRRRLGSAAVVGVTCCAALQAALEGQRFDGGQLEKGPRGARTHCWRKPCHMHSTTWEAPRCPETFPPAGPVQGRLDCKPSQPLPAPFKPTHFTQWPSWTRPAK